MKPGDGSRATPRQGQIKSKQRVADHGEVFTPPWLVEDMLNLVRSETHRIDSRFLEPACGSGNFLIPVLERKLTTVNTRYRESRFESIHFAMLAVMSIYGIELLADNAEECRTNLLEIVATWCGDRFDDSPLLEAARRVLAVNIVMGDALSMTTPNGEPIAFAEWAYLGKGRFQRRDFRYSTLAEMSSWETDSLFGSVENHQIFNPTHEYPPMTMQEIAGA